jgi:transposase
MNQTPLDRIPEAQRLVTFCLTHGMNHNTIAARIGTSSRTIYRWSKGEHGPQREDDLKALRKLAAALEE